jgi:hypothetical protein
MSQPQSDAAKFSMVVEALRPWLQTMVVVGGWAHRLHRLHVLAEPTSYLPLTTRDVDVAIGLRPPPGLVGIRERLLTAGFDEEMSGEDRPPITYYRLGSGEQSFYVEFLMPLRGSDNKRDGTRDTTGVIGGVTAQKLRHLDLLLTEPWSVTVGVEEGFPLDQAATVKIPNPAAYVAQKLLVLARRKRDDRERDVLYIHDTLQVFSNHLQEVRRSWLEDVAPHLHARQVEQVKRLARQRFVEVTDLVRAASRIASSVGREDTPQSIHAACQLGLDALFG